MDEQAIFPSQSAIELVRSVQAAEVSIEEVRLTLNWQKKEGYYCVTPGGSDLPASDPELCCTPTKMDIYPHPIV